MYKILSAFLNIICIVPGIANGYEIDADLVEFDNKKQSVVAYGNVKTRIKQYKIEADKFVYDLREKKINLDDNIIIQDSALGSIYQSESVLLDPSKDEIIIKNAFGSLKNVKISAKLIRYNQKLYEGQFIITSLCNACKNGQKTTPFWKIRAGKLKTDMLSDDQVKLYDVYFDIFDKQVAYVPFFSLPTAWSRGKTGFLMPNIQNRGVGYQFNLPFYLKANKNLDFTFYPPIGKYAIYGLNIRYKVENGGYEGSIFTGSLPFFNSNNTTNTRILKTSPASIKLNSNLFHQVQNEKCKNYQEGAELGLKGQFALGSRPILLYKYDVNDRRILAGDIYINTTYDRTFGGINILNLHNLRLNKRTISLPKANFYNIKKLQINNNFFQVNPLLITHISTNNIYDETLSKRLSDAVAEVKLMTKYRISGNNKITYTAQLIGYNSTKNNLVHNHKNQAISTTLDVHYESKIRYNQKLIEPHILLHLQPTRESFFAIDERQINNEDDTLSIYSTTYNMHPNNIFSSGIYTTGTRSIMEKNGIHIDYGAIFSTYNKNSTTLNKLFIIVGGRQYLTQQSKFSQIKTYNQDLSLAMMRDKFKEQYVSQLTVEGQSFSVTNRTWLTKKLQPLSNEFYLDKNFNKLSTGIQYLFLDERYNFNERIKQTKFERFLKLKAKYNLSENWSVGGKNTIKFGKDAKGQNITRIGSLKGKIQYENECIQIGLSIKKQFNRGRKNGNDDVSSYNLYVNIPSI